VQVRQYKSRQKELEQSCTDSAHRRLEAEQKVDSVTSALTSAQDKVRSAQAQHQFDLQLAMEGLTKEKHRWVKIMYK